MSGWFLIEEKASYRVLAESEEEAEEIFLSQGPSGGGPKVEFIGVIERTVEPAA